MSRHGYRGWKPLPQKQDYVSGGNCIYAVGAASCREPSHTEKGFECKNLFSKPQRRSKYE